MDPCMVNDLSIGGPLHGNWSFNWTPVIKTLLGKVPNLNTFMRSHGNTTKMSRVDAHTHVIVLGRDKWLVVRCDFGKGERGISPHSLLTSWLTASILTINIKPKQEIENQHRLRPPKSEAKTFFTKMHAGFVRNPPSSSFLENKIKSVFLSGADYNFPKIHLTLPVHIFQHRRTPVSDNHTAETHLRTRTKNLFCPDTLKSKPQAWNPRPRTRNADPQTPNPKPENVNPKS